MNGIWYVLLFARKEIPAENLEAFKQELKRLEGRSFDRWRRFSGLTPKGPRLYHKDFILAGTFAGSVQSYLKWSSNSRGTRIVRIVCGVLVFMAGLYLILKKYI